jgi:NAD(P)H dehydrogenase (quinone)
MKILIVYAHPSDDSFTRHAKDSFIKGLEAAGHSHEISDLYKMNFKTDMSEAEYHRESNMLADLPLPEDVMREHEKINACDAIVFMYPLFWLDVPAKLKGWFDRVWTYGFAYGENKTMKMLEKGLVICITGHTLEKLKEYRQYSCINTTMLGDRLFERVKAKKLIILDGTTKYDAALRESNWDKHLQTVFNAAVNL